MSFTVITFSFKHSFYFPSDLICLDSGSWFVTVFFPWNKLVVLTLANVSGREEIQSCCREGTGDPRKGRNPDPEIATVSLDPDV